ncbi:TetR family transcriptional regulator [Aquihabitans daechungensis]|uniref:TetR family transcriptional regulator n=1 Tax=Aquihabitans daechungensis TaxID=1052257 RepID=UPI003BA1EE2C
MTKGTVIDEERTADGRERTLAADATLGLRERKKAMTRLALEDAALELFTRKGFDGTTVDEIADACNVSRRTFFRYFASKEDIFSGDQEVHDGEVFDLIASRPSDEPPLESLRATLIAMAADLEADRARMVAKVRIINQTPSLRSAGLEHEQGTIDLVVEALARRSGTAVDDEARFHLRLVTQAAIGALRAAIDRWVANGAKGELGDVAVEALDALAAGFGRAPRRRP